MTVAAKKMSIGRWYDYDRKNYAGVRLGMSASQLFLRGMDDASTTSRTGWNVGMVMGQQIGGTGVPLFIEGGLLFVQKQVKAHNIQEASVNPVRFEITRNYMEIPIVFKYKASVGYDDFTIQPFAGGFVAAGIGGHTRIYPDRKEDRLKISTFGKEFLRRVDAGLRLGCGMAYQNFYCEAAYDIGLVNVARDNCQYFGYDSFDNIMRTGCFTVTVGIDF